MKPRLLDLYCCQGGAARGYADAGFEVVGVDMNPQPRYPFEFHQGDALEYLAEHGHEFDVWHGSPPCHDHTALASRSGLNDTGHLLEDTRDAFTRLAAGRPWVIENVPGAPMRVDLMLCGGMFRLRTYRHRWFEFSDPMLPPHLEHPRHRALTSTKKRRKDFAAGMHISVTGDVGSWVGPAVMGIDWMSGGGVCPRPYHPRTPASSARTCSSSSARGVGHDQVGARDPPPLRPGLPLRPVHGGEPRLPARIHAGLVRAAAGEEARCRGAGRTVAATTDTTEPTKGAAASDVVQGRRQIPQPPEDHRARQGRGRARAVGRRRKLGRRPTD